MDVSHPRTTIYESIAHPNKTILETIIIYLLFSLRFRDTSSVRVSNFGQNITSCNLPHKNLQPFGKVEPG